MSDNPLQRARQAELEKRTRKNIENFSAAQDKPEAVKAKTKKKPEPVVEEYIPEPVFEQGAVIRPIPVIESEPAREEFPPVLENKAIQPEEVKEQTNENEEIL